MITRPTGQIVLRKFRLSKQLMPWLVDQRTRLTVEQLSLREKANDCFWQLYDATASCHKVQQVQSSIYSMQSQSGCRCR